MPYTVEETGPHSRTAQVTVPVEEYKRRFNKALRQLSKRVKLSGFRKGKIPLSVMRRQYGESVQRDIIEELLRAHVDEVLQEGAERVIYLGQPEITRLPSDEEPMEFTIDYELRPEVDPIGYLGLEVGKPTPQVDGEAIDARIEELRQEHATLEPIPLRTTIRQGDIVELDFEALGDDPALEELQGEAVQIEVGSDQSIEGIEEALEGAEFGAHLTTTIQLAEDFPIEELQGRDVELDLWVRSVKKRQLPEVDDEFAVDTGLGQTLIELRSNLRDELRHELEHQARHIAEDNLVEKLLEQNEFELPEQFVQEQIERQLASQFQQMTGQQIDPRMLRGEEFAEMREGNRDQVIKGIKSEFLLMAIAEKEELQVTEQDLQEYFEHQAQHAGVPVKVFESYARQDDQRLQQAAGSALLEKTLTHLLEQASFVESEWPEQAAPEAAGLSEPEVGDEEE